MAVLWKKSLWKHTPMQHYIRDDLLLRVSAKETMTYMIWVSNHRSLDRGKQYLLSHICQNWTMPNSCGDVQPQQTNFALMLVGLQRRSCKWTPSLPPFEILLWRADEKQCEHKWQLSMCLLYSFQSLWHGHQKINKKNKKNNAMSKTYNGGENPACL